MPKPVIHPLVTMPEALPDLVALYESEWGQWYGNAGPGDALSDLKAAMNRYEMPLCLVATDQKGRVLGTATLKAQSVGAELGYGPFLAAFVVEPEARGCGVGSALVAAIESEAATLGFPAIFGTTNSADGILTRRGWTACHRTSSSRGKMVIYRANLLNHPANT